MAICGNIITTPEMYEAALEKFGTQNKRQQAYMMCKLIKSMWSVEKPVERAADALRKFDLNVDEFNTARDLYNALNNKYHIFITVSSYGIKSK